VREARAFDPAHAPERRRSDAEGDARQNEERREPEPIEDAASQEDSYHEAETERRAVRGHDPAALSGPGAVEKRELGRDEGERRGDSEPEAQRKEETYVDGEREAESGDARTLEHETRGVHRTGAKAIDEPSRPGAREREPEREHRDHATGEILALARRLEEPGDERRRASERDAHEEEREDESRGLEETQIPHESLARRSSPWAQ
jgi:hypothetical protein